MNPYIQFIGRVIRKNENTKHCWVVSHVGLNQSRRFDEFKMFDQDDQAFIKTLEQSEQETSIDEEKSFVDDESATDSTESESHEEVRIKELGNDTLDFSSQYVKDETLTIEKIEKAVVGLSEEGKKELFEKFGIKFDEVTLSKKQKIKPINKRKASRNLLNEKEKSIATDILKSLNLKYKGRNFTKMFENFIWVKRRVSSEVNKKLNIDKKLRKEITNEQFTDIESKKILDNVKDECVSYFKSKLAQK